MNCLYHYCSNQKCFGILNGHSLRMSDIRKSNDYSELRIFYPDIYKMLKEEYKKSPFPFSFKKKSDKEAIDKLIDESSELWDYRFTIGEFSNFVVCFSEECNSLSQWRGYADNGQGCNIGFSMELLQAYCSSLNDIVRLAKVLYINQKQRIRILYELALGLLDMLKGIRQRIAEDMTRNDSDPDTERLIGNIFDGMLEGFFIDSLTYKTEFFSEEKEWRLFFNKPAYKNPRWVCGTQEKHRGSQGFIDTIDYLRNKIQFQVTDNDIIPFFPLDFSSFESNPVAELWIGPQNLIDTEDINLYLKQNQYEQTQVNYSNISYCG